jgi:hypothetical protein
MQTEPLSEEDGTEDASEDRCREGQCRRPRHLNDREGVEEHQHGRDVQCAAEGVHANAPCPQEANPAGREDGQKDEHAEDVAEERDLHRVQLGRGIADERMHDRKAQRRDAHQNDAAELGPG